MKAIVSARARREDGRRPGGLAAALFLAVLLVPRLGLGQFLMSDQVPHERTIPEKEQIDGDMQRSKLRLGPVRILPSVAVTNAGYDSNVFSTATNPFGDWTATISAGARLLLPMGSKLYLVADLFPNYTWYAQLSDRDHWGGLYDVSLFGFFNRMSFQVTGTDRMTYALYSSELPSYVFQDTQSATGSLDIALTRSLSLFGSGGFDKVRYTQYSGPPLQDIQVKLNNRDDTVARGGLRYQISDNWNVSALAETGWSDFQFQSALRDNQSIAYLGSVYFSQPRLFVNATGGYREGMSHNGSHYPEYKTGVGSFFLSFYPVRWIELQGYGHRKITYSISAIDPYYFDNKIAGGANIELFDRVLLRGYVQDGPNTYPEPSVVEGEGLVQRVDHVKYYGGGLSIKLPAQIVLTGMAERQVYTSNVPNQNRNFTRYTAYLNFTGEYSRSRQTGRWISVALLMACVPLAIAAQETPGDYAIGPKDLLEIRVLELPELSADRRVTDNGTIDLAMVGEVQVGGMTAMEVRTRLEALLTAKYVNRASVVVNVKEFNNKPVNVLGAVLRPGSLSISGRWTLIKAISAAGGLTERAGRRILVLRRADNGLSDTLEISTQELFQSATAVWNIPIFPADVINVVPKSTFTVFCLGEVKGSGALLFDSEDRLTLLSVIARAGGLTDRASKKIRVKRRGADGKDAEMVVDYKRILAGEDPDLEIQPNDVVVVKESFF